MSVFLEILVNLPLPQSFTYKNLNPQEKKYKDAKVGLRCEVYFGARKMIGCIIGISESLPKSCTVPEEKIKPILRIIDDEPLFFQEQIKLSDWMIVPESVDRSTRIKSAIFSAPPSSSAAVGVRLDILA